MLALTLLLTPCLGVPLLRHPYAPWSHPGQGLNGYRGLPGGLPWPQAARWDNQLDTVNKRSQGSLTGGAPDLDSQFGRSLMVQQKQEAPRGNSIQAEDTGAPWWAGQEAPWQGLEASRQGRAGEEMEEQEREISTGDPEEAIEGSPQKRSWSPAIFRLQAGQHIFPPWELPTKRNFVPMLG